jgi:hypothetical protein
MSDMSNEVEEEIEIEIEGGEEPKQEASEPEVEIVEEPVAADPEELD